MARNDQLVLAFFATEGAADGAAGALRGWATRNRRVQVDAVGVLVHEENGEVKATKVGPARDALGNGIAVGTALGMVATERVVSRLDELEALGEPEVHTVDETNLATESGRASPVVGDGHRLEP